MILKSRVFDGSGPDIILLHGMFASKENFLTIARGLSDFAGYWCRIYVIMVNLSMRMKWIILLWRRMSPG